MHHLLRWQKGHYPAACSSPHEPLLKQTSLYSNSLTRGKGLGCQIRHGRLHPVLMQQGGNCPAETLLQLACCSGSHDEAEPSNYCRVLKTQQACRGTAAEGQMWSATDALLQRQPAITFEETINRNERSAWFRAAPRLVAGSISKSRCPN